MNKRGWSIKIDLLRILWKAECCRLIPHDKGLKQWGDNAKDKEQNQQWQRQKQYDHKRKETILSKPRVALQILAWIPTFLN